MSVYDDMAPEDLLRIKQETRHAERVRTLEYLHDILVKHPDFRIGQLIVNAVFCSPRPCDPEDFHTRLFYIRDEELSDTLIRYLKEHLNASSTGRKQNNPR